jgi:predicted  nucleic acid-binding Zn-ribbon protein
VSAGERPYVAPRTEADMVRALAAELDAAKRRVEDLERRLARLEERLEARH